MERLRRVLRGVDHPGAPALPIGEAMHPIVLLAVVVLLVNDWYLKAHFHGAVTGKLSDVSGLIFAPCVLSAAIGLGLRVGLRRDGRVTRARAVACTVATGAGFAAVKLSDTAATWLADLLSRLGRPAEIYLDRTDLLCLPALAIAAWVFADELRRVRAARDQDQVALGSHSGSG